MARVRKNHGSEGIYQLSKLVKVLQRRSHLPETSGQREEAILRLHMVTVQKAAKRSHGWGSRSQAAGTVRLWGRSDWGDRQAC